jgi:hypothetical protein
MDKNMHILNLAFPTYHGFYGLVAPAQTFPSPSRRLAGRRQDDAKEKECLLLLVYVAHAASAKLAGFPLTLPVGAYPLHLQAINPGTSIYL